MLASCSCFLKCANGQRKSRATYTAEEVANKDDEHAAGYIVTTVDALECMRLAVGVQHCVVLQLAQGRLGREVVVRLDLASKVRRVHVLVNASSRLGRGR